MREDCDGRASRTSIRPELDGPYIVRNLRKLTNSKGGELGRAANSRALPLRRLGDQTVLRRTHARINFCSNKQPDRTPDHLDTYEGTGLAVLDNRGTCSHFGNCTEHLPAVFHVKGEPFVTPEGAPAEQIEAIVKQCPSGALGFIKEGVRYEGEQREAEIFVSHDQSYWVRGGMGSKGSRAIRRSLQHYALCRWAARRTNRSAMVRTDTPSSTIPIIGRGNCRRTRHAAATLPLTIRSGYRK